MVRPSKRDELLLAAGRVVRREGTEGLTFDAVAAEAGVSKGGLLYHFESKEVLVQALVERLIERFEQRLQRARGEETGPGSFARAYVRASLSLEAEEEDATAAALVAASALAPDLLDPLRKRYRAWTRSFNDDGLDETDALLVRLAVDGLWFAELLGLDPPSEKARKKLFARLLSHTERTAR